MLSKPLNAIKNNQKIVHLIFWLFFAGLFFIAISRVETFQKSAIIVFSMFGPAIPAVYLHFLVYNRFFKPKRYLIYFPFLVLLLLGFGFAVEWTATEYAFTEDDEAIVAGKLSIASFLIISVMIRAFFEGVAAKNKLREIDAERSKAELDSLKMQVNPHFLFNSLNNIYGLLMEEKDKAGDSLLTLSSLLRYLIYASQKNQIGLEEEVNFLEDYMAMERLRLGDKCQLSFNKEGYLVGKSLSPFLLIPFVENAFKHGSFATVGESFIEVDLKLVGNQLTFQVRNSTKAKTEITAGGVGIANVKRRLELEMQDRYNLEIQKEATVFTVKLELEL